MARTNARKGGPLTPREARRARRAARRLVVIGALHMCIVVALVMAAYPHAMSFVGPLAAIYVVVVAPLLYRALNRSIERRTMRDGVAQDAFGR